ncbi:MAG: endonuclease Q family protein [Candidatus Micrarchaeota archaeon]
MRIIADLHVHSKYARATSPKCDVPGLAQGAKIKGISVMATGDFTHPSYFNELKTHLKKEEHGLFPYDGVHFILSTELALFYKTPEHSLRIHNVVLAPGLSEAEQLNDRLKSFGSLVADGRPMLKMSSAELIEQCEEISKKFVIFPAHAWTPYFGVFGSSTGVDRLKDAFEDKTDRIFALETGLSSDPSMNWMLSNLDGISLLSNSDAHSLEKLGREANVFDLEELTYENIINAIKTRKNFTHTYEFYPEEGKYHYDGHRNCNITYSPLESKEHGNICPVCKKKLTLGVLHRVTDLADRRLGYKPSDHIPFKYVVPLSIVISKTLKKPETSRLVLDEYSKLIRYFGSEFSVYEASAEQIRLATTTDIASSIIRVQEGKVSWVPGYDGVFGQLILDDSQQIKNKIDRKQKSLSDF